VIIDQNLRGKIGVKVAITRKQIGRWENNDAFGIGA